MNLSRGALSLLTVLLIFVGLGVGVGWRLMSDGGEEDDDDSSLPDTEGVEVASASQFAGAQAVEGAEVIQDTLWIPVVAAGEAQAYRRSEIATRAAGVVQEVLVQENDVVQAGDLLVQIDSSEAAGELAQAESQHVSATVDFEVGMLQLPGDDPLLADSSRERRERIVRASSGLDQAEVALEQARRQLDWTRVRAPFTGRIADLQAVEGAFLSNGAEVLTLVQLDPIKIEVNADESELAFLQAGRHATVDFSAFPRDEFSASVASVNPIVDPESRSARVTLTMPNPDHRIRPGMYARVSIDAESYPDRIQVPLEAVVERERGGGYAQIVFVAGDLNEQGEGVAQWRYVTTGYSNNTYVEVLAHEETDMVEPGEVVLVDGHHYLAHDTPVRLVDDVAAAGGRPGG